MIRPRKIDLAEQQIEISIEKELLLSWWDALFDKEMFCHECDRKLTPDNIAVVSKIYGCWCNNFMCLIEFYTNREKQAIFVAQKRPLLASEEHTKPYIDGNLRETLGKKKFIQTSIDESIPERRVKPYARRK